MESVGVRPGTVLQDTWRVGAQIGEGGMGEVFEAQHARLPGRYAVKVLHRHFGANEEAFARFRREAEITSALRHPNIVHVMDFNLTPDGAPYLVMEFLDGVDLGTRLQRGGPLPLGETLSVVDQVASALAAAHSRDVVHRDLKPQNVFLCPVPGQSRAFAKVVDFGISKVRSAAKALTRESAVIGTPQYMSPEQAQGRGDEVDARTDQFALASIAYEMLTGMEAFVGDDLTAVMYQVIHEEPPPMPGVPAEVEAVIRRGLSKRKLDRFATVLDFSEALTSAAPGAHVTPAPILMAPAKTEAIGPTSAPTGPAVGGGDRRTGSSRTTFGSTASQIRSTEIVRRGRFRRLTFGTSIGGGIAAAVLVGWLIMKPVTAPPHRAAAVHLSTAPVGGVAISPGAVQPGATGGGVIAATGEPVAPPAAVTDAKPSGQPAAARKTASRSRARASRTNAKPAAPNKGRILDDF